jgi:hypothetical protein
MDKDLEKVLKASLISLRVVGGGAGMCLSPWENKKEKLESDFDEKLKKGRTEGRQ